MNLIKIILISLILFLFISSIVFSQTTNYDFIYSSKGKLYTYSIITNSKNQISDTNNKIGYFILSNTKNKIAYAIYDEKIKLNQLFELNLENKKNTLLLEDKVEYNAEDDVFGVDSDVLFTPLSYDPKNENFLLYNKNGVKAFNNGKSIDLKLYDNNIFGSWGTGITTGLFWKNDYLIFEGFGHEMTFQYLFKRENNKFINLSKNEELMFGGFFEMYFVTGFFDDDIILINKLMGDENSIIFYDLKKMKKVNEIKIDDQVFVKPFGKELYTMDTYRTPGGKKPVFLYKIEKDKKYLISELKNLLVKDYLFDRTDFDYDPDNFLLYGLLWDSEKETNFLYVYNILNDKLIYIDPSIGTYYKIENKQEIKLKSKVNKLRVRKSFDLKSEIVTEINKDDEVQVLNIGKLDKIDNITDNWIKIKTKDNIIGWCFKGYLY